MIKCPLCKSEKFAITEETFEKGRELPFFIKLIGVFLLANAVGLIAIISIEISIIFLAVYVILFIIKSINRHINSYGKQPTSRTKFTCLNCEYQRYITKKSHEEQIARYEAIHKALQKQKQNKEDELTKDV